MFVGNVELRFPLLRPFGVVRGMYGTAEVRMRDGTLKTVPTSVRRVERDRSQIFVGNNSDQAALVHGLVRVELPGECSATRPR